MHAIYDIYTGEVHWRGTLERYIGDVDGKRKRTKREEKRKGESMGLKRPGG